MPLEKITLQDIIPREILQTVQDAFSEYTGLAAMIADANGVPVTKQSGFTEFCKLTRSSACGREKCQECGRNGAFNSLRSGRPSVYQCHAGMVDFAAPILLNGEYIGHFAGGQTRVYHLDEELLTKKAVEFGVDPEEYIALARQNTVTDWESVERAATFLMEISKVLSQIAYERLQVIREKSRIERAAEIQNDFLRDYSQGAVVKIQPLVDYLKKVGEGTLKQDDNNKIFAKEMSRTLQRRITLLNESVDRMDISTDKVILREGMYDIRMMMERKINELQPFLNENEVEIVLKIGEDIPQGLIGDAMRIGEVIGECVRNCVYRNDASKVEIEFSTTQSGYGVLLEIVIKDNGEEISEEHCRMITDYVNSRRSVEILEDNALEKGMAMTGHILYAMSGTFVISSEYGVGNEIRIHIPQLAA